MDMNIAAVATQTIFVPGPSHSTPVPIAPIVGGALGGVALAVFVVCAWRWWTRSIHRQQMVERRKEAKRKAYEAALAHRRAVLRGSGRTLSASSKSPADRAVQFKSNITAPMPLKPSGNSTSPATGISGILPPPASHRPIRPSPLRLGSTQTTTIRGHPGIESVQPQPQPRTPRLKASLASLSSSDASSRRFSWRALLTGPGFTFRQIGVGTGNNNRLSQESSLLADWSDAPIDPSIPVGYAYDGLTNDNLPLHREKHPQTPALRLDSNQLNTPNRSHA